MLKFFTIITIIVIDVGKFAKVAASASYSQSSSSQQAEELNVDTTQSLAVTTIKCLTYKFGWIDDLNEDFGLAHLHPDFENDLNCTSSF
jgi:hypothetical protein